MPKSSPKLDPITEAVVRRMLATPPQPNCIALKGGTAIDLFVGDMPRLSVGIDLTYL